MVHRYLTINRLAPCLDGAWVKEREERRKTVRQEISAPRMSPLATAVFKEEQVKREMERRLSLWLHKKGLSADFTEERKIMKRLA